MSSVPTNKLELCQAIQLAHDDLLSDYSSIPEEYSRKADIEGNVRGTQISPSDTVAYLIGWGRLVLKWHELKSSGRPVDFPETGYKWNELGRLAQHFHTEYRDWRYEDLLTEFTCTTAEILNLVDSLSDQELYGETWYRKYPLGRMIQLNTSSPMKNVRSKVRKFKRQHKIK